MSDAIPVSPRAAIRKWLRGTESKSTAKPVDTATKQQKIEWRSRHASRSHHSMRYTSETENQYAEKAGRKRQRHSKGEIRQKRATDVSLFVSPHQLQPQTHLNHNTAVEADGLGLAERLGLHAPFRTFKDHSDNDVLDVQGRPRKRKRSRSSTSSYLEPAAADDLLDNGSHATISRTARMGLALGDRGKNDSPTASQGSEMMVPSPGKLSRSYERRPRHKTRQDRYELKDNREKTKQATKRDRTEKKQKKRKRKEKSGAALMHDFTAHNVAHDRLTLKPTKSLGLFGKGRASSPVRRRGLPDLAFSEMTFLASRRERPRNSFKDSSDRPLEKKKLRKSIKAADPEAEVSRYFTSARPTSLEVTSSHGRQHQKDNMRSRDHESPQASVDLPSRPFLGFGTYGPNTSISPPKRRISTQSRSLRCGDARCHTHSTSYLTWSQTEAQSCTSPLPNMRHYVEPLKSSSLLNRHITPRTPHKTQQSTQRMSPHCVQKTSSEIQGSVLGPLSKHEVANETPSQSSDLRSATDEPLRSNEKSGGHEVTETIKLDAAGIPQDTEDSVPENTHAAEATTDACKESAVQPRNQATCQSSRYEPRCKPQAYDVPLLSGQMSTIAPPQDSLDDILEALHRDCNTNAARGDPASRAPSSHRNLNVSEEARIPDRIEERSNLSAGPLLNGVYPSGAPMADSISNAEPRNANLQRNSAHDGLRSMHTPSMRSVDSSSKRGLDYSRGYQPIPAESQMDSRNAWNGYDDLYERQQEQADLTPETSREQLPLYVPVPDQLPGLSSETGRSTAPKKYAQGFLPVEVGDEIYGHRPLYRQETRHVDWDDQCVDHVTSYDRGESHSDEFSGGGRYRVRADDNFNDYQQRETSAGHERSFAQGADQHDIQHQLFTTNISDNYSSWRPHHTYSRNHGLVGVVADAQVRDVDPALSGFWTPQKLY